MAHLNYEGGNYVMGVKTIAAGETVTIDVRALRDSQVADEEERTIPQEITRGQARWTIIQSEGTDLLALMGRSEQVDEARAISSTYACQNCCGDFAEDVFITPSQVEMQAGQSVTLSAFELRSDCYGFTYPVQQSASWSSSNSSVATVSGGQVTAMGGGETTIKASWNSFSSVATQCNPGSGILGPPDPIGTSCCRSLTSFRSANATVQVVPRIDSIDHTRGVVGVTYGVEITGSGFGSNPSLKAMDGITPTIDRNFSTPTKIVADFAISPNAMQGNRNIIVVAGGKESSPQNFLVQVPGSVRRDSINGPNVREPGPATINDQSNRCGAYWDLTYQLYDKGNPAQKIMDVVDVTETVTIPGESDFEKIRQTNENGIFADLLAMTKTYPNCPSNGETATARQTFIVTVEGRIYSLTTRHRIEFSKSSSGQYSVNVVIEIP